MVIWDDWFAALWKIYGISLSRKTILHFNDALQYFSCILMISINICYCVNVYDPLQKQGKYLFLKIFKFKAKTLKYAFYVVMVVYLLFNLHYFWIP